METFFTADTHFFHEMLITGRGGEGSPRPMFKTVEEMNETIVAGWNSVVTKQDRIFHLGDFALGMASIAEMQGIFDRLNGQKILIPGNHDMKNNKVIKHLRWSEIYECRLLKVGGRHIWLSHYPHLSWPGSCHGSWHLHGHSHGNITGRGHILDVGVDCNKFTPIAFPEVAVAMATRGENPDQVPGRTLSAEDEL
jgi:calcineurin-like phosphoesterase family protein